MSKYFITLLAGAFIFSNSVYGQRPFLKSFKLNDSSSAAIQLPPSNNISQISVEGSVIWIGTSKGVAKSVNGGKTWESYRTNSAFANDGIFAISTYEGTTWVATGYEKEINDGTVQTGSGYAFSIDSGKNWIHRDQTLDTCAFVYTSDGQKICPDNIISYGINDSIPILPVVVPEQNVTFDISLSPGTVWIASWASGLRKSIDNGQTWERILLPADNRNSIKPTDTLWYYSPTDPLRQHRIFQRFDPRLNNNFLAFAVYAVDNTTIWCGTAGGINRSTDGGVSWVKFNHQNQASPILGNWVIAVREQHYQGKSRIWTTNWKAVDPDEEFGVSYTDDGGKSWTNLLRGIRAYDFAFKDSSSIAYIATDEGVYRTADGGLSFIKPSTIIDQSTRQVIPAGKVFTVGVVNDTVIVGTDDGIASTIDNAANQFGSTWKIYRTYQTVGSSNTTYAYPNPFSPGFQSVRIHYGEKKSPSSSSRTVSIEIFDFGMNHVRTLLHDAQRSTTLEFDEMWDGKNDGGRLVANGVYFYRIKVDSDDAQFGKILVLQ